MNGFSHNEEKLLDYISSPINNLDNFLQNRENNIALYWHLSVLPQEQALEIWGNGLSQFGQKYLALAAIACAKLVLSVWDEGMTKEPDNEILASVKNGYVNNPHDQIKSIEDWIHCPCEKHMYKADETLHLSSDRQIELDEPVFNYLHQNPYFWTMMACENSIPLVTHPNPELFAGKAMVAFLKSLLSAKTELTPKEGLLKILSSIKSELLSKKV